ncbi:aminoglycoside phosphotransferase (APT) family kinase protein [Caulobacter ginsengisoli]|uniref:Aminoglycoside phosphotransferase (APT) family kinase protein n=1 Tax=Caulobacter ginsengisoli TaxID=400775 RepID=A0ABU0IJY9_9CAUL|nr:phosphotransferase family protein [Caulobacter ginsengisoli]MDQ0462323.1 aminoglycoside phosphotransferase (APT) family kinase protein [Caulobacter ginsengisoli]
MSLTEQLEAYLTRTTGLPTKVVAMARIPGGASRETYRFDADVGGTIKPLILRRDPVGSLIDTDRRLEFLAFRSFHGRGLPVPEAIALEEEGAELERPFFIMGRIDGGKAGSPFSAPPYGDHARAIGEQFFGHLGAIAAADPLTLPISEAAEAPALDACWKRELDYWSGVIEADELHPQPIVRAAIRRLRANPPPPAQKLSVVHGDYRTGNFLHDGEGRVIALLDWEMAHLGDPLEDLGWAMDPLWCYGETERVCGMVPRAQAIALWEKASGLKVDLKAFAWWELFASVKGQAIWTSSAKEFRDGGLKDPVLGFSGWYTARRQDIILADRLSQGMALLEAQA